MKRDMVIGAISGYTFDQVKFWVNSLDRCGFEGERVVVTCADQASLNVLLSLEPYRDITLFDHGELGWACEAATMEASARGPELSYQFSGQEPLFDGDVIHNRAGKPFCIVHQYDRIQRWKSRLEQKFG